MAPLLILLSSPTSGGPYFWSAKLSTAKGAPFAAWITGWFNLLGQVAVTTGISYACATFLSTTVAIGDGNYVANKNTIIGIYAAVLVSQVSFSKVSFSLPQRSQSKKGAINTFGVHLLKHLNNVSIWWHALGTFALVIATLAKTKTHASGKFVFTTFYDGTGGWGIRASHGYVICIGARLLS
jgi:amino acid transporter